MTIFDVLEGHGWPTGRYGRTTCPIHGGDNRQAFSYTDDRWYCFACGAGGGIKKLLEHFEPERLVAFEGIAGPLRDFARDGDIPWVPLDGLRPSTWLLARLEARARAREEAALACHQRAMLEIDRDIPWVLKHGGEALFDFAGAAYQQATYRLWVAEEVLGCQCL